MKRVFFSIFLLILFTFTNISYGIFIPHVYQSDDKKILAFAELNAATLTLPSGQKIESTNINGDTGMAITTITSPLEIVLVIDTSGSMEGNSMEYTKQSASTLVRKLFEVAKQIQVSIISFDSESKLLTTSSDEGTILSTINGLEASGGTNMSPALDIAKDIFDKLYNDENNTTYPYLVVLTDGETVDENYCYQKLLALQEAEINIYNILVSGASKHAFSQNGVDAGIIYENITAGEISSIYDEIYFQICSDFINNDISDFIENAQNYFVANDDLYMYLDSELIQGSLLQVEYLVNIKCAMNCTELILQNEVDPKLSFDPNAQLISENNTNSYYGWEVNEKVSYTETQNIKHNLVLTLKPSNSGSQYIIPKGGTFQCKLVLSCLLDTGTDPNFVNNLTFLVKGIQNNAQGSQEIVYTQTLDSMETNVIPPFGKDYSYTYIYLLLGLLSSTLFIILVIKVKRSKK